MRVIGKFRDGRDVNGLVDSLRNIGLDRKDMIISNTSADEQYDTLEGAARETILIKNETDSVNDMESFASGIAQLRGNDGIIVAVEVPKNFSNRVQGIMEDSGAVEVFRD
jgi:hypothetical protein